MGGASLPYRTGPEDLVAWAQATARGRSLAQLRPGMRPKLVDAVANAAELLGVARHGALTELGRELALAEPGERRARLREALLRFAPFRELLEEVRDAGAATSEASWIEAWWATRGYGSSPSNREEGGAALGRFAEHAGLGRYVAGRRGHPTRIEWDLGAVREALGDGGAPDAPRSPHPGPTMGRVNRVEIALEGGRAAVLELPLAVSRSDKRRLLELVELLVAEE